MEHTRPLKLLPALLLPLLLAACTHAQDITRTTTERIHGRRELMMTGLFVDADTVLVQVYHDGKELLSEPFTNTFSLALGTFTSYEIKFTDTRHRVKRLSLHELSDDMLEFYPPIEVDFSRQGNMVLIKQSNGKPDWIEFDVGLGRKRTRD